jgi:DNA-binding beta-propeller fold protein YncE
LLGHLLAVVALAVGPTGSLTPVAGPAGCIVPKQASAAISCTRVRELKWDAALVSPDGRNLYTLGGIDTRSAIAVMQRDRRTGAVRQLPGRQGCLVADWGGHATFASCLPAHLNIPVALAMTPDGRELVYVNHAGRYPLNAYNRSPRTGALSRVDCCGAVRGLACGGTSVATSPDGRNVYATNHTCTGYGLSILVRDPSTGKLTQPKGEAGCIQRIGTGGCARAPVTSFGPFEVAVTPDGAEVYVTTGGLFVFARNRATGTLKSRACYLASARPPCDALSKLSPDLHGFFGHFTIAPDGRNVYLISEARILVLARRPSGELSQLPSPKGCVTAAGDAGRCTAAPGLPDYGDLTISPDGRTLYVTSDNGLVVLDRNPADGSLSELPGRYGRVRAGIVNAGATALSPDGRFFYAPARLGEYDFGVRVLRRTG